MKHCGQYLSLLWVALTLLCPQILTASPTARSGTSPAIKYAQLQALPLLSDFTLPDLKKTEDKKSTPLRNHADSLFHESSPRLPLPTLEQCATVVRSFASETGCVTTLGLPLSCGPPAQA